MNFYQKNDPHPEMRRTPCYGFMSKETGETIYYLNSTFLEKQLKDAGHGNFLEKYKYMSEIGLISTSVEKSGKIRYRVKKRFESDPTWYIEFFYSRAVPDDLENTSPYQTSLLQKDTEDLPF